MKPTPPPSVPVMRFIDWASLRVSLLWAYDGPVARAALKARVTDSATSCWLIRQGRARVETARRRVEARPGDWLFVASPTRQQDFSEDIRILSLHFDLHWPDGEPLVDRSVNRICRAVEIPELERRALPLVRLLSRYFPGAKSYLPAEPCPREAYLRILSLMPPLLNAYLDAQEYLGAAPQARAGEDERILRILELLDRLPLHQPLQPETLTRRLGISRSHLDAIFTARMGLTPRGYWEQRRLDTARQMLRRTGKSVKTIAHELGFRHESHFCLWFKRLAGVRPGKWREG